MKTLFRLNAEERWVVLVCLVAGLCAKAGALYYTSSFDDYVFLTSPSPGRLAFELLSANGRIGGGLLLAALSSVGLAQPHANILGGLLAILNFALVGLITCRLWRVSGNVVSGSVAACLITLHPYHSEIATFRVTFLMVSVSLLLASVALYFLIETQVRPFVPVILLAVAYSIYQIAFSYAVLILAGSFLIALLTIEPEKRSTHQQLGRFFRASWLVGVSIGLYFVANHVLLSFLNLPSSTRFSVVPLSRLGQRALQTLELLNRVFLKTEPIFPASVKALLLLMLLIAGIAVVRRLWDGPAGIAARLRAAAVVPLGASIMGLIAVGVILIVDEWWPAPRTMSQFGVYWGFVFSAGYICATPRWRGLLVACATLACFSFAGLNNLALRDQFRMNTRDLLKANRIIMRLEAHPDFGNVRSLVLVGGTWGYPSPLPTTYYDMNVSALYAPGSRIPVINEATGYNFSVPSDPKAIKMAGNYCSTADAWPGPRSATVVGEVGVVCLGKE